MKTFLKDRILWWDGITQVTPDRLGEMLIKGMKPSDLAVTEMSEDVSRFNWLSDILILEKDDIKDFQIEWKKNDIDLDRVVTDLIESEASEERINRLVYEYSLFIENDLEDLLKTIIYIIQVLTENNVMWGVGRGSSCASYLLYRIGLHEVDPIKYDIPISEFFKEEK